MVAAPSPIGMMLAAIDPTRLDDALRQGLAVGTLILIGSCIAATLYPWRRFC